MADFLAAGEDTRRGDELQHLCGEMASIFRRAWGRGPVKTTARWAGRDLLVVMMENGHNDAEKALRAAGHIEQLVGGRRLLQKIVEDDLVEAVEQIVGRSVITCLSATRLDPDLSAEIFVLEPVSAPAEESDAQRAERAGARARELQDESRALAEQTRQIQRRHPHGDS